MAHAVWPPVLDEAIDRSAAPGAVRVAVARLLDDDPGLADRLAADGALRAAVVAVAGASRALTVLCQADPEALAVLAGLDRRPALPAGGDAAALRRWHQLELLRIAARDLVGLDHLPAVGAALAALADDVLAIAGSLGGTDGLVVVAMGKAGARELNYASDVDVLFVGDGEAGDGDARTVMDVARQCFRVDANLRPEGRDGPLVRTLDSYEAYWARWAQAWEFQALLKARPVAGDPALGEAFAAAAGRHVWGRSFGADDLRALRSMKARAEGEVARRGLSRREVKRGHGGIRDVEFSVQLLQLVHGRQDPDLRVPGTLDALAQLSAHGYVDPADAEALDAAYRFLRAVEHRLQLVDLQQVHAVPADVAGRDRLARVMGYRDTVDAPAVAQLDHDLRRHQATVRSIHERLYFRPLLEAFTRRPAGPDGAALAPEAVEARLAAFGFRDADRTRQAVRELTRGLTRSSRLMQQFLPLLLEWLSESPDPDLGLLGLRTLASGAQRSTELATAFRESPEAARRLCLVAGTSRLLTDTVHHNPDLIPVLGDPDALAPRSRDQVLDSARQALALRPGRAERHAALARLKRREELLIAGRDLLGLAGVDATAADLTALAEATVEAALSVVEPPVPFAVVAMGRFAGVELSYASDLDVLFVYEGDGALAFEGAERAAEDVLRFVGGATPAGRIYDLDPDLRPEGKQGPLARSLDGYRAYLDRYAQTWERQALVRARPVAGDLDLGRRFVEVVDPYVWRDGLSDAERREIRRMKARVERERIPAGEDPQFHLKLGRGSLADIEWTAQLLQLEHGVRAEGTMAALARLTAVGALAPDDTEVLAAAYRFCERTRNRWFLVKGAPGDSLPTQPEQLTRLARSLGMTATDLRETYRRVTRRARQVVERVFYGSE